MTTSGVKARVRRELMEYGLNVVYLTLVFGSFTIYRRLLLAGHDIVYTQYGVALIQALVLGKVIMIGSMLRIARGLETRPLIYPTLYKSAVFCVFVVVFKIVEHGIRGLLSGEGFLDGVAEIQRKGRHEVLANVIVVFVALIPFFAVKELGRVLGKEKIAGLFFRARPRANDPISGSRPRA